MTLLPLIGFSEDRNGEGDATAEFRGMVVGKVYRAGMAETMTWIENRCLLLVIPTEEVHLECYEELRWCEYITGKVISPLLLFVEAIRACILRCHSWPVGEKTNPARQMEQEHHVIAFACKNTQNTLDRLIFMAKTFTQFTNYG